MTPFHISRLPSHSAFALLASTEWPGVEPPDVELGDVDAVTAAYPAAAQLIRDFAR